MESFAPLYVEPGSHYIKIVYDEYERLYGARPPTEKLTDYMAALEAVDSSRSMIPGSESPHAVEVWPSQK